MRWLCVLLILLPAMIVPPARAQDDDLAPYLYYYSDVLNGIVIERADGTDSRIIGQGLVMPGHVYGPGWTPDGQWFAWQISVAKVYGNPEWVSGNVVGVDGSIPIEDLEDIQDISAMFWDASYRYLLVKGQQWSAALYEYTYWLFDINTGKNLAWATLVSSPIRHFMETSPIEWSLENQQLTFYDEELTVFADAVPVRVTMHFDGSIEKEVMSEEDYEALLSPIEVTARYLPPLDSPSRRYVGKGLSGIILDTWTNRTLLLPGHSDAVENEPIDARWHPSEKWVLLGYESCWSDCAGAVGNVSVMSLDGRVRRELSNCGFSSACVGWLPDTVDVNALPPGAPQSVLPAPITIEPAYHIKDERPGRRYQVICNEDSKKLNAVKDVETGEIVFVMPHVTRYCFDAFTYPEFVAYTVSPDGRWYAVNEPLHEYWYPRATVYELATGKWLFSLNINALYGLEFSADGRYLTTRGVYADSVWDIEQLLATYGSE